MRICLDIDGTVCELKSYIGSYEKVLPLPGVADFIRKKREEGHEIILYTARHMKTCSGNQGKVLARQGMTLFEWLRKHEIEYDEIYFGKPQADVYIDDNAIKFNANWGEIENVDWLRMTSQENQFKLNIVITMAGAGSRFAKAGYELTKPLIPLFGKPMYRLSTNSLPLHLAKRLVFIIQKTEFAEAIKQDIRDNYSDYDYRIVEIEGLTRGQAETCLLAKDHLYHNIPTLIHNSDSAIQIEERDFVEAMRKYDGVLVTFNASEPRFSYAHINPETGSVDEVREKQVISCHASTGTYYFKSTVQMLNLFEQISVSQNYEQGELYIAPVYNSMIEAGQVVQIVDCKGYFCYGTPQELKEINLQAPQFMMNL